MGIKWKEGAARNGKWGRSRRRQVMMKLRLQIVGLSDWQGKGSAAELKGGFIVLNHDTGLLAFELGGSMLRHEGICVVVVGMVFLSTVHDARDGGLWCQQAMFQQIKGNIKLWWAIRRRGWCKKRRRREERSKRMTRGKTHEAESMVPHRGLGL